MRLYESIFIPASTAQNSTGCTYPLILRTIHGIDFRIPVVLPLPACVSVVSLPRLVHVEWQVSITREIRLSSIQNQALNTIKVLYSLVLNKSNRA